MVSRKQKKLLHYVEEGSVPKLKSYLRKHRQLPVTFAGRKGRTPLHVACTRREGGAARLLLRYGADPMIQDQKGNTPLHLAAREAVRKGERVYEDLVVPLRKYCPAAMDVLNEDGVTPREILRSMTKYQQDPGTEADEASDDPGAEAEEACDTGKDHADREWYCKLFGECEDEFYQKCGRYEGCVNTTTTSCMNNAPMNHLRGCYTGPGLSVTSDSRILDCDPSPQSLCGGCTELQCISQHVLLCPEDYSLPDPEPCTYDDWAERLAREYAAKRAQAEGSRQRRPSGDREREQREFQQRLEAEHQLYLERGAKKAEEVAGSRKRRYEQGCAQVFGREGAGRLGYADVPWPDPRGTVEDMVGVILHGVDRTQRDAFRRYLRQQRAVWHPDRFAQRCGGRLLEADRQRVLDTVTALSQALNRLAESIR